MKKETIYIIVAFIIAAVISFFCVRKLRSGSNINKAVGMPLNKKAKVILQLRKQLKKSWSKDSSKYADRADLCTECALKLAISELSQADGGIELCKDSSAPNYGLSLYDLVCNSSLNANHKRWQISERTFNALVQSGLSYQSV